MAIKLEKVVAKFYESLEEGHIMGRKCPACGADCTGKFCPECGAKKPATANSWKCSCGAENTGKFCPECGARKPQYRCDKCGWQPEDPTKAPRFCPECGDPFDAGDIV